MWSPSLRSALRTYYQVEVGRYSYGSLLCPGIAPPGTRIGNYCSFAADITVLRRNHPTGWLSQHPLFFNPDVGLVKTSPLGPISENPVVIGHDVWIGHGVIITPGCQTIGNGAIVAAGSVLTKNIEPFAIVAGVPARVVRFRYPEALQMEVARTAWWLHPVTTLAPLVHYFIDDITIERVQELAARLGPPPSH